MLVGSYATGATLGVLLSGLGVQAADNPVPAILRVLQAQTEAWNRGDLEAYMEGYWKSDKLTFYGGGTVVRGWQATLERYRRRYQSEGRDMGRLDFPDQEVEILGPDTALARGHYHLSMPDGSEPRGLYTVILRKLPEGWRIVHDHSSSE